MNIESLSQIYKLVLSNTSDILGKLNIGDVLRAQILDITANEVMLKLFDGTTFQASTMVPVDARPGDTINLFVKGRNDNQLLMEILKGSEKKSGDMTGQTDEIKKQLTTLDIKPQAKNVEIAYEFKKNNIPLSKDLFQKVLDLLGNEKEFSPAKALFLAANKMENQAKSIESLNKLIQGRLKVGTDIDTMFEILDSIEEPELIKNLALRLAKDETDSVKVDTSTKNLISTGSENMSTRVHARHDIMDKSGLMISGKIAEANINNPVDTNPLREKGYPGTGADQFNTNLQKDNESDFPEDIKLVKDQIHKLENETKYFTESNRVRVTEPSQRDLQLKTASQGAGNEIILNEAAEHENKSLKREIHHAFERLFVKADSENARDINIKELYKDLYHKLEIVKEVITSSVIVNKDDILNKIENIQDNIKFLNQIHQNNSYIQIPLHIFDRNTTGELYVLKRGSRRRTIDPNNATLFISLDTENMGRIESLLHVDKKNVSINMRVTNQSIIDFIKENYKELYNGIMDKGYRLVDMKYRLLEKDTNILNVNEVAENFESRRFSLDLRI